jgi:hypothetical protein
MNKRLEKEFGEQVAEKRGWHWSLTSFGTEVWGQSDKSTVEIDKTQKESHLQE